MGPVFVIVVVLLIAALVPGVPAFVIAQRRGLSNPWVAFVPLVGLWIVLCESTGQSGWFAVLALIPMVGLLISIWMAFAVPVAHGRSRWWIVALLVPGLNLAGYWLYALTMSRQIEPMAHGAVA